MTYEVSRAVDEEHRVAEFLLVTVRILEHEDGVVWQVILVYVRDGLHIRPAAHCTFRQRHATILHTARPYTRT